MVFTPLETSSSSVVNRVELTRRTANGRVHALLPALLFAVSYALSLVTVGLMELVILRIKTGQWRPMRRMVFGTIIVAFVLSLLSGSILFGMTCLLEFAWLTTLRGVILTVAFALTFLIGRVAIVRIFSRRPKQQIALTIVRSVLILIGLVLPTGNLTNLPVPKWTAVKAEAAGSTRATAGDMATLLIELSNPQRLGAETATQLQTPQVRLSSDLSWGLGSGIQHS